MYENSSIGVVVPAYNEAGFVGEVLETLPAFVDRAYAIDDRSTDETWAEIQRAKRRTEHRREGEASFVVPIRHEENRGVGGAIKTGYLRALEDDIDVIAVMGGDGQMDPEELVRIVEPVVDGRADYAKGNRLIRESDHAEMPPFRYVGNVVLTYLTKVATGYWHVGDPQMGYTVISRSALEAIDIEAMYEFYGYCNDLLVRLSAAGQTVVDVPAPLSYGDETSTISYAEYIPRVSLMLLRMFVWRLATKRDSPSEQLRTGLFVGGAAGAVAGLVGAVLRRRSGLTLVGVVALLGGMVLDMVLNRPLNGRSD
ncbi:glycosyltransferase [Natronomonas sp. CBA1123]|uniref:glycosyltransferase family 2 protein n=1 Tax=Natronomonas sp. CBA1123 TaxID=2668070 RepID=UPI0012EA6FA6|nr:glycosyltransferase family 2 protein [Natronomonas sp. CBA1123]MUV86266.1 glycosyltransferase [Natronomonas sp. CBA1123]